MFIPLSDLLYLSSGQGDPWVLLLMGLGFVLCYPVQILQWAQSKGWLEVEWKHVILFFGVVLGLYLLAAFLAVEIGDEEPALCLLVPLIVLALKFVIHWVLWFTGVDKWRY
ncbi:hypothetical protein [Puniceicoccus vermicola]|uniref:Uncharacterized protein n=1 Tax=Puniceicoccus vermicola TaxID=388746 RepID=A0A7X1B267_9BACT|nr:hypothetical protein [Puniceicoccus vermicola]MBC2604182.1 hypothetical protein [Puniceicoccus vermicola]